MINYFLISAFRSLIKHRDVSFVGILSLSIGISVLILIMIFTRNELKVDSFHHNSSQIFKVSYGNSSSLPGPLSDLLHKGFPEIQKATHIETRQIMAFSPIINHNNNSFEIEGYYTIDSLFFDVFDFEVLHGDINAAVSSPFSLILTESEARRIFNIQNPIGEMVTWKIHQDFTYTVKAIVEDPPQNSSIQFKGLVSESSVGKMGMRYPENWGFTVYETYLLLHPDAHPIELEPKLREFLYDYYRTNLSTLASSEDAIQNPLELHLLKEVYFNRDLTNDTTNRGNIMKVRILITVAIIIMLLSIINYIILSVAKASTRAKEIGVAKVHGANRSSLIFQYITETIILSLIATFFGLIIARFLLPVFGHFMSLDKNLKMTSFELSMVFPGALLLGVVAGIYPAFVISAQKTIDIFKKGPFRGTGVSF